MSRLRQNKTTKIPKLFTPWYVCIESKSTLYISIEIPPNVAVYRLPVVSVASFFPCYCYWYEFALNVHEIVSIRCQSKSIVMLCYNRCVACFDCHRCEWKSTLHHIFSEINWYVKTNTPKGQLAKRGICRVFAILIRRLSVCFGIFR